MVIHLGRRSPSASCDRPGDGAGHAMVPLFGLATSQSLPRFTPPRGGFVTVALVLASRRTGVTRWRALWSPDFPQRPSAPRPSDLLGKVKCTGRRHLR